MSQGLVNDVLCDLILHTNKNIQFVALINKHGRPVEKISRSGFTGQFQDNMNEMFFMQCVLQVSMGKDFDECYGPINYYVSERSNLTMLSFPLDDHVLLTIVNKNISPITLARKIVNRINDHKNNSNAMI